MREARPKNQATAGAIDLPPKSATRIVRGPPGEIQTIVHSTWLGVFTNRLSAKRFAHHFHRLDEAVVGDRDVRPDDGEERVLRIDPAGVGDEDLQDVEGPTGDVNGLGAAQHTAPTVIELK